MKMQHSDYGSGNKVKHIIFRKLSKILTTGSNSALNFTAETIVLIIFLSPQTLICLKNIKNNLQKLKWENNSVYET